MNAYIDLHIHTALSPCADNDMTPNNIVNMALLKGLDIIAITDHNAAENVQAVILCAQGKNIIVVPGMEIETKEEVHLICLFPDIQKALEMQKIIYKALPPMKNREDIFGQQVIMDEKDRDMGRINRMLITAANMDLNHVVNIVNGLNGIVIPAHVDRNSYSIVSNLGVIPEDLGFNFVEVSTQCNLDKYKQDNLFVGKYKFLRSSDAHSLGDILERVSFVDVDEISIAGLFSVLRK